MAILAMEGFDHFSLGTSLSGTAWVKNLYTNATVRGTTSTAAIPSATVVGTVPSGMAGKALDLSSSSLYIRYDNLNTTGPQNFTTHGGKYTIGMWIQWDEYTTTSSSNFIRFSASNNTILENVMTISTEEFAESDWRFKFAVGANETGLYLPDVWYHIEVLLDIDNDQVTLKIDGTTVLNAVSYTFDHATDWQYIYTYGMNSSIYIDHYYILDDTGTQNTTGLGKHIIYPIEPDTDNATIFDWSFTEASGVASLLWNSNTYVYTDVVDDEFRVSFDPISSVANTTTVYAMSYNFFTKLDNTSYTAYVRDRLTDGTNTSTSSSYSLGATVMSAYIYNADLAGTAWTLTQADNMEAGVIFDGI